MRKKSKYSKGFSGKSIAVLTSAILVVSAIIGGTLAYLTHKTEGIENVFNPSDVTTEVLEERDASSKKNVQIKNTGDTEAYIRAAVVFTWQDEEGNVSHVKPKPTTDYVITPGSSKWDMDTTDGYFYYKEPVAAGAATENLYNSISVSSDANPPAAGYYLTVEIIGSGIQSKPTSVVVDQWGVTLGQDGTTISKN